MTKEPDRNSRQGGKDLEVKLFELEREVKELQQVKGRVLMSNRVKTPIIDISLVAICIWWSVVLFHSNHMFDKLPELYTFFGEISQESDWGVIFIVIALFLLLGVWKNILIFTRIGLFSSVAIFAAISAGFFMSESPMNTGSLTYAVIALQALWRLREVGGVRDN